MRLFDTSDLSNWECGNARKELLLCRL